MCKGVIFHKQSTVDPKCKEAATVKRSQLVNYYNELVIHLRIAEHLVNTSSVSSEIQESNRAQAEKTQKIVIELLRKQMVN